MNKPKNILQAWAMVEYLAEGDIKPEKHLKFYNTEDDEDYDFYNLFKAKLEKLKKQHDKKPDTSGIVLYLGIFDFVEVIEKLRKIFNLEQTIDGEELNYGKKLTCVLCFDSELKLKADNVFYTIGAYLNSCKNDDIGYQLNKDFKQFEKELKAKLDKNFSFSSETKDIVKAFNQALNSFLREENIELKNCRYSVEKNIANASTLLHSFYIDDLYKAITNIDSKMLQSYLSGNKTRINLDSDRKSLNFALNELEEILTPSSFPLGRFPSKYPLSFMQQVAVNLLCDSEAVNIQSVNGPPGTGKTTLLKDVFADLIVQQAYEIASNSGNVISGNVCFEGGENGSLNVIKRSVSEKSIVLVSSNNGALQNIVNELPQVKKLEDCSIDTTSKSIIEQAKELDYFKDIANDDFSDKDTYWGLFALEGGRKANMDVILKKLEKVIEYPNENDISEKPKEIYEQFLEKYEEVLKQRNEINMVVQSCLQYENDRKELEILTQYLSTKKYGTGKCRDEIKKDKERKDKEVKAKKQDYDALRKNKIKEWLFNKFASQEEKENYKRKLQNVQFEYTTALREQKELDDLNEKNKKYDELQAKVSSYENIRKNVDKWLDLSNIDVDYADLQSLSPWFNNKYRQQQSELFIEALKVRKCFILNNIEELRKSIIIWNDINNYKDKPDVVAASWHWINLAIPVISSTFASFHRMTKYMQADSMGYIFCDEAGQAVPQAAVGAIMRCHKFVAVGDPKQIKPVLTVEPAILQKISEWFDVGLEYLSDSASVQVLVDKASAYGYYTNTLVKADERSWIGIPLWVHRRSSDPMFSIANAIAYGNKMVLCKPDPLGKCTWYDIKGSANDKYVKEQGEKLKELILDIIADDGSKKNAIYVIAPFKNVATQLANLLDKQDVNFTIRSRSGKPLNIGTVHTFQGKETDIVFLVLGADENAKGAAAWAVSEPNILNVAATRAKKEFYIIGDKELYKGLNCETIKQTVKIIDNYNELHD